MLPLILAYGPGDDGEWPYCRSEGCLNQLFFFDSEEDGYCSRCTAARAQRGSEGGGIDGE